MKYKVTTQPWVLNIMCRNVTPVRLILMSFIYGVSVPLAIYKAGKLARVTEIAHLVDKVPGKRPELRDFTEPMTLPVHKEGCTFFIRPEMGI